MLHDAEDMVHPQGLGVIDRALSYADFVQLPVRPEPTKHSHWIAGHYGDEFTESHAKALVVRDVLGAALPAAGVGCGIARDMLDQLAQIRRHEGGAGPFSAECLTEDYELGLLVARSGGQGRFIRMRDNDGALIATRSLFPTTLPEAVRQKTPWIHGIALQGWDRMGWSSHPLELWMTLRDRRGPLTALVLAVAYLLLLVEAMLAWLGSHATDPAFQSLPERMAHQSAFLHGMMLVSTLGLIWRAVLRFTFTHHEYGLAEALRSIVRIPVANIIAIMAGRRAFAAYLRTLFGGKVIWEKTTHRHHPAHPDLATAPVIGRGGADMKTHPRRRGEPALALVLLLGGWTAARAVLWEPLTMAVENARQILHQNIPLKFVETTVAIPQAKHPQRRDFALTAAPYAQPSALLSASEIYADAPEIPAVATGHIAALSDDVPRAKAPSPPISATAMAGAHQMLWMAAAGNLPLPEGLFRKADQPLPIEASSWTRGDSVQHTGTQGQLALPISKPMVSSRRWSADGWLMWREGSAAPGLAAAGIPSYGTSQMGAVLRYRLTDGRKFAPAAYLRGTAALNGLGHLGGANSGEKTVAFGLSVKPLMHLPLSLAVEGRIDHFSGGDTYLRPAAMVVSAIHPINLPTNSRAEIYAQLGYVGGGTAGKAAATAFADGQLRVDHSLDRTGNGELRAGFGLWGGAQKGTTRLDIGPTATIALTSHGSASARVAVDYRFRLMGNAAPSSGAAISLSAGF